MKFLSRVFELIFEPFKWISSEKLFDKIAKFFSKNQFFIYIIAFIITYLIFYVLI